MSDKLLIQDLREALTQCRMQNGLMEAALQLELQAADQKAKERGDGPSSSAEVVRQLLSAATSTKGNFVVLFERGTYRVLSVRQVNPDPHIGVVNIIANAGPEAL